MNRGQIRDLTRTLLSEPSASYWVNSELDNYINDGLYNFCDRTDCLEDISTDTTIQYQGDYDVPSDCLKIKKIEFVQSNSISLLDNDDIIDEYDGLTRQTGDPDSFCIFEKKIRLNNRPSTAAASTTLSSAIATTTATSVSLTSSASFPRCGRIYVGSECIIYWNNASNVLTGCVRGAEGTTATTHLSGVAVYLRDLYIYHTKFETLNSDTTTPTIPTQYHEAIAYYAAAIGRRKSKDHDLAREYMAIYEQFVNNALSFAHTHAKRKYTPK